MKKNDIFELTIEDLGNDGEGIAHLPDGITVFVKDTVIGDRAKVIITKPKKTYAYGKALEILEPSPYRVDAICPNAKRCGGCSLMQMSYEQQLSYKFNKVKNCLIRIGGIADVEQYMEPICGMEHPYNYRNKMQFPVGLSRDGEVEIGFYAGHTHNIINLESCAIGHPVNDVLVEELRAWIAKVQKEAGNFVYNEESHTGLLRHILMRVGFVTGELMVCFVINGKKLPKSRYIHEIWDVLEAAVNKYNDNRKDALEIKIGSVSLNINTEKTNKILGDRCVTLWGNDYIEDYIGDVKFEISPLSFYQVNPAQTKVLYDKAVEYAGLTGKETVWDMYCGIGTISLAMSKKAKMVYGVEIVPQAIEDAKVNAYNNNIDNAVFMCGKAEEVVPDFYEGKKGYVKNEKAKHPDVVVVDPPRKGCDETLLDTIVKMSPDRMVYVSCDPATLARDLKFMLANGFKLEKVCVVDQFGHSSHVETVALLSKCKN